MLCSDALCRYWELCTGLWLMTHTHGHLLTLHTLLTSTPCDGSHLEQPFLAASSAPGSLPLEPTQICKVVLEGPLLQRGAALPQSHTCLC